MATIELELWKIAAALLLMLAVCVGVWFKADAYYSGKYTALAAEVKQQAADQTVENAATLTRYAQAATEVNDESQSQISLLNDAISRLLKRPAVIISKVPGPASGANCPNGPPNGPAVPGHDKEVPDDSGSNTYACLAPDTLREITTVGMSCIYEVLEWRKWARLTGAAQ